jgi:hypothetical protein
MFYSLYTTQMFYSCVTLQMFSSHFPWQLHYILVTLQMFYSLATLHMSFSHINLQTLCSQQATLQIYSLRSYLANILFRDENIPGRKVPMDHLI